ncbi:MAG: F0F1 ATP synthase subunit epsilon [Deltaproteobacteria bacterium]|nr:F0F1 ATP synthase subunit epsilon [Deltaproteobacteria bacterium]
MAEKIQLDVVTPNRLVVSDKVDIVVAPGVLGEFGVLVGHIPFLSTLKPGELRFTRNGKVEYMAITGGFAEVQPDKVTVLADSAELAREIDLDRARMAKERAEERLRQTKATEIDHTRAEIALQRALTRLRVAQKSRD